MTQTHFSVSRRVLRWTSLSALVLWVSACGGGGSTATVTIAPLLSTDTLLHQLYVAVEASPIEFTNSGGRISSCTVTPDLPDGLQLDQNTCAISGTPTLLAPHIVTYAVNGTNIVGSSEVRTHITIGTSPTPTTEPTDQLSIDLSRENPQLTDNNGNKIPFRLIVGVPLLTIRNNFGLRNLQAGGIVIENLSTVEISACSIDPELPRGLVITDNPYYCLISGNPEEASMATTYTVTALGPEVEAGEEGEEVQMQQSTQATLDLGVNSAANPIRLIDGGDIYLYTGSRVNLPIVFANTGSDPETCINDTVNEAGQIIALPENWTVTLSDGDSSCQIDILNSGGGPGNPDAEMERTVFRIHGEEMGRVSSANVAITVLPGPAPGAAAPPSLSDRLAVDGDDPGIRLEHLRTVNLPLELVNTGSSATTCRIDSSEGRSLLPNGLSVELYQQANGVNSCSINGLPRFVIDRRRYVVLATNAIGSSSASFDMTVAPVRPEFEDEYTEENTLPAIVLNLNSGDLVERELLNIGGQASYCRFVAAPDKSTIVDFVNYQIKLIDSAVIDPMNPETVSDARHCLLTGTAPDNEFTFSISNLLYVELGNPYNQKSVLQILINLAPSPPAMTPPTTEN